MGSFGERLRREREMRGITVEEIAEATKIGTRALRALEAEEFDKLPGGVFNKGFVRAYARYLGIDEEQAVADYLAAFADVQAAARAEADDEVQSAIGPLEPPPSSGAGIMAVVVVLLVGILGFGGWKYYARRKSALLPQTTVQAKNEVKRPAPAPTSTPAAVSPSPASTSAPPMKQEQPASKPPAVAEPAKPVPAGVVAPAKPAPSAAPAFTVTIRATEDAWVSVTADGQNVLEEVLRPSAEKALHAQQQLAIRTGNAGALEISFNGKPLGPVGNSKQVRTLNFTPDGLQPTQ